MHSTWPTSTWSPGFTNGGEPGEGVIRAAKLEGARALEVFALEEDVGAGARLHGARRRDRRSMRGAGNLAGGALDVGKYRQRHYRNRSARLGNDGSLC